MLESHSAHQPITKKLNLTFLGPRGGIRITTGDGIWLAASRELTYDHEGFSYTNHGEGEEEGGLTRCNIMTWVKDNCYITFNYH